MLELFGDNRKQIDFKYMSYVVACGVEIGTLDTFFSFENSKLGNAQLDHETFEKNGDGGWRYKSHIKFVDAHLKVSEEGCADQSSGSRTLNVEALENSRLMDAVLRFVIAKDQVQSAFIGDREIIHQRRNHYYQYPLDQVTINLKNGAVLTFHPVPSVLPRGFENVVYLRDEPEKWILHIRALAMAPSYYVLKGCTRWYNRPFPAVVQHILLRFPWLSTRLLYVRERISQRIPIQVNGAVDLPKGCRIQLAVHWCFRHDSR
jgi:hypothetical protein